ncbi:phage tail tape measure protein [Komagataeibacter saccharivorans]|uniref:hypothetical protein n=1 Tax=Komagataeibacter saccharivorans TaxID=265959 RepID=UPI000C83A4E8|nr:hypothetical protein [Komagataeibacter saccharivorans]
MPIEAYEIGVNLVANATRVTGPIGEMIEALERLLSAQRDAQEGFNTMVSALGGARRLAGGMATDMERAARAARDIASSSGRFRGVAPSRGASGGNRENTDSRAAPAPPPAMPPIPPESLGRGSYVSPYSAAAIHVPGAPQLLLPPPEVRTPGTALMVLPNQGDSMGNGANFRASVRPTDYEPNWTIPPYSMNGEHGPFPYAGPHAVNPGQVGEGLAAARGAMSGIGMPRVGPLAAGAAAYAGFHGVGSAFSQGIHAGDTEALMANAYGPDGHIFSPAQQDQARDVALNAVRTVPGASYTGTLEMIARTSGITANADEALALAPHLSMAGQIFSMRGAPNAISQIESAIQSGEIAGLNAPGGGLDVNKLRDFIDRLSQTAFAMQGTFDLGKYLTGLRQFGTGASASSMDFLTAELPSLMRVMQESRAGTALASLDQLMLSPPPTTRNHRFLDEQRRIGIRDRSGHLVNEGEYLSDRMAWYTDVMVPAFARHGITSRESITNELNLLFSRSTVQRLGASLFADEELYSREIARNRGQQAQGDAPLMNYLQNAPGAQFAAFTESWRAFEAVTSQALMVPVVKSVQLITSAFNDITRYVQQHPDDIRQFGNDVHGLVTTLATIAGVIGKVMSIIPGPIRRVLESTATYSAGGAALGSVVPFFGNATGALGGAAAGLVLGTWQEAVHQADRIDHMQYRALGPQPVEQGDTHVHVYLDSDPIAARVQVRQDQQARQEFRATGTEPDPRQSVQVPGRAIGR